MKLALLRETAKPTDQRLIFGADGAHYAASRPNYPGALFAFIASQCSAHARVWDCGCGNGQAARGLAPYFAAVCATDLSSGQLATVTSQLGIHFAVQSAEAPAFAPASFDAVCVAQALHWFDLNRFWPAILHVLRPGGVFAAWGYSWFTVSPPVDRIIDDQLKPLLDSCWSPQNRLLWRGYQDITWPFAPIPSPVFAISVSWTEANLWAYMNSWSAMRRCVAAGGAQALTQVRAALIDAWGEPGMAHTVTMPLVMRVGRAG